MSLVVEPRDESGFNSMAIWRDKPGKDYHRSSSRNRLEPYGRWIQAPDLSVDSIRLGRQLFGWTVVDPIDRLQDDSPVRVRCIPTNQSLEHECAYEIFGCLISQLPRPARPDLGPVGYSSPNGRLRWHNRKVADMLAKFDSSGPGTSTDALVYLVPVLCETLQPPEGGELWFPCYAILPSIE